MWKKFNTFQFPHRGGRGARQESINVPNETHKK